jgi:lipopolysaccharide/colanic/teichoic acid biosynthesis glycosyltransferase
MSERNQLTIFDSPFDRDDTEYMPGTDPRIHSAFPRIHSAFPRIHPAFDFAVAAIGLIVFAPIFLVISIAIKLDSRGPIFIREPIVGYNNQVIQVFKFRFVAPYAERSLFA